MAQALVFALLPPAATHYALWRRKVHLHFMQRVMKTFESGERSERLWRSLATRVGQEQRLELRCCPLTQYAWLDTFYSYKMPSDPPPQARGSPH